MHLYQKAGLATRTYIHLKQNENEKRSQTAASTAREMPTTETEAEDSCLDGDGRKTDRCCCPGRESSQMVGRQGPPHLRVGLLGCGWFSRRAHVPVLLKLERRAAHSLGLSLRIEAICSRSQDSLDAVSKLLNDGKRRDVRQYTSQAAFLADPAVDVVIVALPIPIQCAAIEAVWRAGKHVISEKPAAPSAAAAARLWSVMQEDPSEEEDGGCGCKTWCVLENWAYKPGVSRVSNLLRAGSIGEVARFVVLCYIPVYIYIHLVVVSTFKPFSVSACTEQARRSS